MRLIDSTKLIDAVPVVEKKKKISLIGAVADMVMLISEQPVIEADPVRHGRWLVDSRTGMSFCSECLDYAVEADTNYCPNCGADMRGDSDE